MGKIRVAIVGVGNCASALVQGVDYYKKRPQEKVGLMHRNLGGYDPGDIEFVLAYDIDYRKVGKSVAEAIFSLPNNTKFFNINIEKIKAKVKMGIIADGFADHLKKYDARERIVVSRCREAEKAEITRELRQKRVDVMMLYLPVGSEIASRIYANCALEARVALVNCIPVFIASDEKWATKFQKAGVPVIGDDIKSQIGATIIHRTLVKLFEDRGAKIDKTYQLNVGGNSDFLNMLNRERVKSKKISKTEAVQSQISISLKKENISIGPSDYVPWLQDNKICFLRIEGRIFGNIPVNLEMRLSVEDSPNSASIAIDAIRCAKLAQERKIGGVLVGPSAYFMKCPPKQFSDSEAKIMVENFIENKN